MQVHQNKHDIQHEQTQSLQIAKSSVSNTLRDLLGMIYSVWTKDSNGTPEYIFWKSIDINIWVIFGISNYPEEVQKAWHSFIRP